MIDTKKVVLEYPRNEGNPKFVEVDLMCVRAADGLRISYDFERDGWKIEQAAIFSWDAEDEKCDPDWQEVAFVKAWAREKKQPWDDGYVAPAAQPAQKQGEPE